MSEKAPPGGRRYPLGPTVTAKPVPPSYGRVVERLTLDELRAELDQGRGTEDYREAVRAELERRAST